MCKRNSLITRHCLTIGFILAIFGPLVQNGQCDFILTGNQELTINSYHFNGTLHDTSSAFLVSGGIIGNKLWAHDYSTFDMSNGNINALYAYEYSTVNISGGSATYLQTFDFSVVTFYGLDFLASGGLNFDGNYILGTGTLSGKWIDGTPWSIYIQNSGSTSTIMAIPEPATILLLGLGAAMIKIKSKMGR